MSFGGGIQNEGDCGHLVTNGKTKIAIDPGALFFYYFRFTTLIPKSQWRLGVKQVEAWPL